MRPPGYIPGERARAGAHGVGGPVDRLVPRRRVAVPGFRIEAANVGTHADAGAPRRMREYTHETVAGVRIHARRAERITTNGILGGAVRNLVRLGDSAAVPVARRWISD